MSKGNIADFCMSKEIKQNIKSKWKKTGWEKKLLTKF